MLLPRPPTSLNRSLEFIQGLEKLGGLGVLVVAVLGLGVGLSEAPARLTKLQDQGGEDLTREVDGPRNLESGSFGAADQIGVGNFIAFISSRLAADNLNGRSFNRLDDESRQFALIKQLSRQVVAESLQDLVIVAGIVADMLPIEEEVSRIGQRVVQGNMGSHFWHGGSGLVRCSSVILESFILKESEASYQPLARMSALSDAGAS